MDRVATEVAKSPAASGDLPSFEELLAKGSFQARLARARAEREKVLAAEAEGSGDFVLNTTRKPWERDPSAPEGHVDVAAPDASAAATTTAQVHPFPGRARKSGSGLDAAIAGLAPATPAPVASPAPAQVADPAPQVAESTRPAVTRGSEVVTPISIRQAMKAASTAAPGAILAPYADAERRQAVPPVLRGAVTAGAPARPSRRRAILVAGGFAFGIALGIAATILPARFGVSPYGADRVASLPATLPAVTVVAVPPRPDPVLPIRNPVIVAAMPTAIATPPAAGVAGYATSAEVPSVPGASRAAPSAVAAAAADVAPVAVAVAFKAPAPQFPTVTPKAPPSAEPGDAIPVPAAILPALAPMLSAPMLDDPDAAPGDVPLDAQTLPAAFSPQMTVDENLGATRPAGPLFEGRLVVHAPQSVSDEAFQEVLDQLTEAGYPIADSSRVPFTIKQDNIRYFHAADADLAGAIAEDLGARLRDFTSFSPAPPTGTIEIWLSGRGADPAATKTRRASGTRPSGDQQLLDLRSRILQQLRNGDHL